jgi:signal transduction histidine kinase
MGSPTQEEDLQLPFAKKRIRSNAEIVCLSLSAGIAMFAVILGVHWLIYVHIAHEEGVRVLGASAAAFLAFLLVWFQLLERRRVRLADLRRYQLIADMNHHIRNALQTISYQRYSATDPAASERLREAVERIEWVLEELLPDVRKR